MPEFEIDFDRLKEGVLFVRRRTTSFQQHWRAYEMAKATWSKRDV